MYGLQDNDIKRICDLFADIPKVMRVVLFGSRAMGNYKPGSDIDLAITGDITFDELQEINARLEDLSFLYSFDVQRLNAIKDEDLLEHINRVGIAIYSRS